MGKGRVWIWYQKKDFVATRANPCGIALLDGDVVMHETWVIVADFIAEPYWSISFKVIEQLTRTFK